ncbi:MAG: hypothetical protein ACRD8W_01990 [Nitrososphaeraceae archaeon]
MNRYTQLSFKVVAAEVTAYRNCNKESQQQHLLVLLPYSTTYEANTFPLEILDQYLPTNTLPLEYSTTTSTVQNELYIYNIYNIYNIQYCVVSSRTQMELLG